ncbi:hypothetical protein [Mycolicibacterium aichiense]|uniref:hypothetical protein n=1 Tax=Mycolicibacterium aichiense TaxID=1799 RepID=UPI000E05EB6F|nr:hypothetical protein [Mycolicibacterium aichiense]MCV7016575.1 hypothetical protein [Mycolicibacterium aichiense]SUA14211.1 Uncharacterised protein [Mycolicibacterium aichiense]
MALDVAGTTVYERSGALGIWALTVLAGATIFSAPAPSLHQAPADPGPLIVNTSDTPSPDVSVIVISHAAPGSDPDFAAAAAIAAAGVRGDQRPARSPLVSKIRQVLLGPLFDTARR